MKIIFLDFDGVLNSRKFFKAHQGEAGGPLGEAGALDPEAVARLNRVIDRTEAKVVVSSSWRHGKSPVALEDILKKRGFTGQVIGRTPDYVSDNEEARRGSEIQFWLEHSHLFGYEVNSFVIFDDYNDMIPVMDRLIQTTSLRGLEDEHVERAIDMLTSPRRSPLIIPDASTIKVLGK